MAREVLPEGVEYGQLLRIVTVDGDECLGQYWGVDDADESWSGLDEICIDDGINAYGLSVEEIALIERVDS